MNELTEEIYLVLEDDMDRAISHLKGEFNNIRAGRANPHILDKIFVDYYGTPTPLQSLANITVPEAGLYRITLDTKEDVLTIEEYTAAAPVFDGMCIAGSFNEWGDTPMNPCNANAENHDWYLEFTFAAGDEVKFKQSGSWDYNKGGAFITEGDNLYGFGVGNGDNLAIPADGTYLIIFNDITGVYRFIKK